MTIKITEVNDVMRPEIDRFLRSLLDNTSQAPMFPRAVEAAQGLDSIVLAATDEDGDFVGGLWAGDPYTEWMTDPIIASWPEESKKILVQYFTMLHHVAVIPSMRRQGVGRYLMEHLLDYCTLQRKGAIYGVTGPENIGWYTSLGYRVGAPEQAIHLKGIRGAGLAFPIVGESRWFYRALQLNRVQLDPKYQH